MSLATDLQEIGFDVFDMPQDLRQLDRLTAYMTRRFNAQRADRFTPPSPSSPSPEVSGGNHTSESFTDSDLCTLNDYRGY